MSRLKKASLGLLGFIVLLIGIFIVINLGDEPRSAAVDARLALRKPVPAGALEGFQYELGLFAPANEDPRDAGAKFYSQLEKRKSGEVLTRPETLSIQGDTKCFRRGITCWPVDFKEHVKENEAFLKANHVLLTRYRELLKFPGAAGNLKRSLFVRTNDFSVLRLSRLQGLDWMMRIASHSDSNEFFKEWKNSNEFFKAKLQYPDAVLGMMISLSILNSNREFMTKMMQEFPALKPPEDVLRSATLEIPFDTIANQTLLAELEITDEVVHQEVKDGFISLSQPTPPTVDFQRALILGYRPNQTLNDTETRYEQLIQHPCIKTDVPCPTRDYYRFSKLIRNPVGNFVIEFLSGFVQYRLRDAYKRHLVLTKPL